jgi:hypothetical protein
MLRLRQFLFGCEFSHVFRNLHGTEVRAAHGAEVSGLCAFGGKSLMKLLPGISALAG